MIYYNGNGLLPFAGTELRVTSAPGLNSMPHVVTYSATGNSYGKYINYAQMVSDLFQGVNVASFAGEVKK